MSHYNNKLSIVVPTYNRAQYIDKFIECHLPQLSEYDVAVYIFDNASTDDTEQIIKSWQHKSHLIQYIKNEENIGAVNNVIKALTYPKTDYIWMVGDTYHIPKGVIRYVLQELKFRLLDVILLNLTKRGPLKEVVYNDYNQVLNDLGAVCSCLSVTVLRKSYITQVESIRFMDETKYPHTLILFNALVNKKELKLLWLGNYSLGAIEIEGVEKDTWLFTKNAFEIGLRNWTKTILSLHSNYSLKSKNEAIKEEFKYVIPSRHLFKFRGLRILNNNSFKEYKTEFRKSGLYIYILIYIIKVLPPALCMAIFKRLEKTGQNIEVYAWMYLPVKLRWFIKKIVVRRGNEP